MSENFLTVLDVGCDTLRTKIEIRKAEPQSLDCDLKQHELGTAPCEVLGIGSGFVRCASDVLKTTICRGDKPRAVLPVVQCPTINPFFLID
jgi:hypothetical protein